MKTVLTIAGSDCSGGAGIQADLKTMGAMGVYGMSVITALTAQNTQGVFGIMETTPEFLEKQLDCIFTDIFPDAVKIGMVSSAGLIEVIANTLNRYLVKNIVIDPIMASTSGTSLLDKEAEKVLKEQLFPLATVLTPNVPECEKLTGMRIREKEDMVRVAKVIGRQYGCAVACKGGHFDAGIGVDDVLVLDEEAYWFCGERIQNENNHGTGCTYSSALACGLAKGFTIVESAKSAKEFMNGALRAGLNLGKGNGPLNHFYRLGGI